MQAESIFLFCRRAVFLSACEGKQHVGRLRVKMNPCCMKHNGTRQSARDGHEFTNVRNLRVTLAVGDPCTVEVVVRHSGIVLEFGMLADFKRKKKRLCHTEPVDNKTPHEPVFHNCTLSHFFKRIVACSSAGRPGVNILQVFQASSKWSLLQRRSFLCSAFHLWSST